MAPQTKRASKEPRSPAKKSKTQAAEKADPLAPILLALASSEKMAASCDTLQAALPHCLGLPKEERHGFQKQIVDCTVEGLNGLETSARAKLAEAEANVETLRAQSTAAKADFDSDQLVANKKKEESDAKAVEVENLGKEVSAAKDELKAEIEQRDAFFAHKASLSEDKDAFEKVLEEVWQPLKAGSFDRKEWRKRDKACAELVEKSKPLGLEESLVEALKALLKIKPEQRSAFSQKAVTCLEEAFEKHRVVLADRVAGAAGEEAAREAAVTEAQAKLSVIEGKCDEQDKEYDELQNAWAELETKAGEAKNAVANFEVEVESALEEVTACKAAVDAAVGHIAAFAALLDPPKAPAPAAEEAPAEPQAAEMETAACVETEEIATEETVTVEVAA